MTIKSFVLFFCIFLGISEAHSQRENVWTFGTHAGVSFNSSPPALFNSSIRTREAAASVCDLSGQLLFYTDGNKVWNRNHNLMPNGAALITDITYDTLGPTSSTGGGALIVPYPADKNKYYIFSLTSMEQGDNYGRLYYSTVDMTLDGGLGNIVATQKGILIDTQNTEHLTAVAGNRCNIWLLIMATPSSTSLQIKAFDITDAGINTTPVVSGFTIPFCLSISTGQMDVSPRRDRIAASRISPWVNVGAATELFTFDPATGLASDHIMLDSAGGYGLAFSPDGSKLYKTATGLDQYDLSLSSTAAIISSLTAVGMSGQSFIKRGPDGSMYVSGFSTGKLSAVPHPNLPGMACGFIPNAISLANNSYLSLPNLVPVMTHDTFHHTYNRSAPCFAGSMILTAPNDTSGWDYTWSTGATGSSATVSNSGAYSVSYRTPPCNFNIDTFYVQFGTRLPSLSAKAGCYHQNNGVAGAVPYPGDTTTYIYTWKDSSNTIIRGPLVTHAGDTLLNAANGHAYWLTVLAPDGCDTTLSVGVPLPGYQAAFAVSDTLVCVGEPISFQHAATTDITGFSWDFGDGSSGTEANPQHRYDTAGSYTIRLIGHTGFPCYDTAYARVTVDSVTSGIFTMSRERICTGEAIGFSPQTDTTFTSLDWDFGDGSHILNVTPQNIGHAYDHPGRLPVTLTTRSRACPPVNHTDTVYVYPLPVVHLGEDTFLCLRGSPLYLYNLYADSTGVVQDRHWSTGDTTAMLKVVHAGTYSLTIAAGPIGCSTTDEITINKDCYIDIPNVFTPNGDGVNDYFFPRQLLSRQLTQFSLRIFNRWGQVVFETARTDGRGWDGKFNNRDQPEGVYVYVIEAELAGSIPEQYEGNVTLIR